MKIRVAILFLLIFSLKLTAYEETLIDFNNLGDTMIDFSASAGDVWTADQKKMMRMDLSIPNWSIRVNASSWTVEARDKTRLLAVNNSQNYPGITVLGVKVYFPQRYANSYVMIKPPFVIPFFYEKDKNNPTGLGDMFLNKGVVRNVGVLRRVTVRFLGNNFKYALYIRLEDNNSQVKDIYIGYLDFVGWRTKSWINPNIDEELTARQKNYVSRPYYPDQMPSVRLLGIIIERAEPAITGNFVTMIKDVVLEFDEAFLEVGKAEYKQEDIFGVYREDLMNRAKSEMKNVDKMIYLQWLEDQKMDKGNEKTLNVSSGSSSSGSSSSSKSSSSSSSSSSSKKP